MRGEDYLLRGSEVRTLATVGAFRVVPAEDLREAPGVRAQASRGRHLPATRGRPRADPAACRRSSPHHPGGSHGTRTRRAREPHASDESPERQTFYAGRGQTPGTGTRQPGLSRVPRRPPNVSSASGGRIRRVVLDYELKGEYQRFLQGRNRARRNERDDAGRRGAGPWPSGLATHHLPVLDEHVQFPDVRIEYEHPDGRLDVEDIEVMTPHYRGALAAAKARSGLQLLPVGVRSARIGGRSGRAGGGQQTRGSPRSCCHDAGGATPARRRRSASRSARRLPAARAAAQRRVSGAPGTAPTPASSEARRRTISSAASSRAGSPLPTPAPIAGRGSTTSITSALYRAIGEPETPAAPPGGLGRAVERFMVLDHLVAHRAGHLAGDRAREGRALPRAAGLRLGRTALGHVSQGRRPRRRGTSLNDCRSGVPATESGYALRLPRRAGGASRLPCVSPPACRTAAGGSRAGRCGCSCRGTWRRSCPSTNRRFDEELRQPVRPDVVDEMRWYFEQLRGGAPKRAERGSRRRDGTSGHRGSGHSTAPGQVRGDRMLSAATSPVTADAIARGDGRLECQVAAHQYLHLSPLVGTA